MRKISGLILTFGLLLVISGCKNAEEKQSSDNARKTSSESETQVETEPTPFKGESVVNVVALANKSHSEFEHVFGDSVKSSPVRVNKKHMPGEYREYRVISHPKGLSVRFHKDKAKRFNLLLGAPSTNSTDALMETFVINVSRLKKVKGDPLSDTWKGKYDGVNFKTVYAKRDKAGGNFIMLHAEVE